MHGRCRTIRERSPLTPDTELSDSGFASSEDERDGNTTRENLSPGHKKLIVLSAPDQSALSRLEGVHKAFWKDKLTSNDRYADELDDLAYTLGVRRSTFQWRSASVAGSVKELQSQIQQEPRATRAKRNTSLLFCFTGQGAQWYAMGRELMHHEVYAQSVATADSYLKRIGATWSVVEELHKTQEECQINKPQFSQPLCTILQIALVELLRHWNVTPTTVIGHSSGEIAAAYTFGALSVENAWKIAYHRGRVASNLRMVAPHLDGGMMAVGLSEANIKPYIARLSLSNADTLCVACINSPSSITISGDKHVLQDLEAFLKADKVFARSLAVENAYHSAHMCCVANEYLQSISDTRTMPAKPGVTMLSSVTGSSIQAEDLHSRYWVDNMCSPVQFLQAVEAAFPDEKGARRRRAKNAVVDTIVEIGPHGALQGPIKQTLTKLDKMKDILYVPTLTRNKSAVDTSLLLAGSLWCRGVNIDLARVNSTQRVPEEHIPRTDLPSYPWNHTNRYWHETAASKSHRFRHAPRTDLLGAPVREFSQLEPSWKNVLRISELPWIADHKVRGSDVFPAAAMICAPFEAARQIGDSSRPVEGFELRDITIGHALIIPPDDPGIEVFTNLKPRRHGATGKVSSWFDWTFVSVESSGVADGVSGHVVHSSGLVKIIYRDEAEMLVEKDAETAFRKEEYAIYQRRCTVDVPKTKHYENASQMGFDYGPTFQGLVHAKTSGNGQAVFELNVTDTKSQMPAQFEFDHMLHPSTLDNVIQTALVATQGNLFHSTQSMVPTGLEYMRVSAQIPHGAGEGFIGYVTTSQPGFRDLAANIAIGKPQWDETLLEIRDLRCTGLGDNTEQLVDNDHGIAIRKLCSELVWKPDVNFLSLNEGRAQELLGSDGEDADKITKVSAQGTKATAIYIKRALHAFDAATVSSVSGHFEIYLSWLRQRNEMGKTRGLHYQGLDNEAWLTMSNKDEEEFLAHFAESYPLDAKLLNTIGRNLYEIVTGAIDPLSLMLKDDLLTTFYSEGVLFRSGLAMFRNYFDLLGHKKPAMRILEIGAGTGSITKPILEVLGGTAGWTPRFGSYCYTDISAGWFTQAEERFKDWQGRLEFKVLDIEKDPLTQGFEAESFDVIAASNVLHATTKLNVTLANCHRLLKPGGKLVIGELTYSLDPVGMIFGTLPGWWLSQDGREGGPLISQEEWSARLAAAKFSGIDHAAGALDENGTAILSTMVSTKTVSQENHHSPACIIVHPELPTDYTQGLASQLSSAHSNHKVDAQVVDLATAAAMVDNNQLSTSGLNFISLLEADAPILARCSQSIFENVRKLLLSGAPLLWVSSSVYADGTRNPEYCAVSGLLRTARSENPRLRLREMHLRKRSENKIGNAAGIIERVLAESFCMNEDGYEDEIVEIDGFLKVSRLIDESSLNNCLQSLDVTPQPKQQSLIQPNRPLKLTVSKAGQLDTLHFIDDDTPSFSLADDEIEVDVKANGLNADDVLVAMGVLSDTKLGTDVAGVVRRIGNNVQRLKTRDRVTFPKPGGMATIVRVDARMAQLIPDTMTFEDAAALPLVFMAAYQSLINVAHIEAGDRVLIHAAVGGKPSF